VTVKRFEDISAWMDARELAKSVYQCTGRPSFSRDFGLRDQIQRAAGLVRGSEFLVPGWRMAGK